MRTREQTIEQLRASAYKRSIEKTATTLAWYKMIENDINKNPNLGTIDICQNPNLGTEAQDQARSSSPIVRSVAENMVRLASLFPHNPVYEGMRDAAVLVLTSYDLDAVHAARNN